MPRVQFKAMWEFKQCRVVINASTYNALGNSSDVDNYKLDHANMEVNSTPAETGSTRSKLDCTVCHKTFSRRKNVKEHYRFVHQQEKNNICQYCSKAFARKISLRNHIADIHEQNGKFNCRFCDKRYLKKNLRKFMKENIPVKSHINVINVVPTSKRRIL